MNTFRPQPHPRPRLYMTVGMPGCGKTTWAKTLKIAPIVSSDQIREQLYGDENEQGDPRKVFEIFHAKLAMFLANPPYAVVADSTALQAFARKEILETARSCGAEIHVIFFKNPDVAIRRNEKRERRVPDDVMVRMAERYEQSRASLLGLEGFDYDSITYIVA